MVTLGVARDPKCIFPYRGEGFLEGSGRKTRLCYPKKRLCYPKTRLCYPKKQLCYPKTRLCYRRTRLCYRGTRTAVGGKHDYVTEKHGRQWAENTIMLPRNTDGSGQKTQLCYRRTRLCYRKTRTAVGRKHDYVTEKTRTAVGRKHDCDTEKHGPSGLKSPAVEPAKHDRAGCLRGEAPVRPMRVAARVEIPSRRAGETRFIGASPCGGAPQRPSGLKSPAVEPAKHGSAGRGSASPKADVTRPRCLFFRVRQA